MNEKLHNLRTELSKQIIGHKNLVDSILIGLLTQGHILIEGVPGLAKTTTVNALSKALGLNFKRAQFTPDLLPSDILGAEIYDPQNNQFKIKKGPIFTNLLLADEINRAPAKVQSALLEAMQERQITIGDTTYPLPKPFLVLATQNPIEQEGTYPLPEAQMDRFLVHTIIDYPDDLSELEIMRLNKREASFSGKKEKPETISQQSVFDARKEISEVKVTEELEKYMVSLISASRYPEKFDADLAKLIDFGASPRGTIGLDRCSRVNAWMQNRDYVTPEDIHNVIKDVLRHRIALSYKARAEGVSANQVIDKIIEVVAVVG